MTLLALLAAIVGALGFVAGLKRKASRERDARVRAEIARDQARGEVAVVTAQAKVDAEVHADQTAGHRDERAVEAVAAEAAAKGEAHPERRAAQERQRRQDAAREKLRRLARKAGR